MVSSRTTTLPPKDLVRPSTSTAMAPFLASAAGMAGTGERLQGDRYRLADAHVHGPLRQGLDAEHEAGALLLAVDDRGRELGLRRDEVHARNEILRAAVAVDRDPVADVHLRQDCLRHEEAYPDVLRRQQRHDRPAGLHH